MSFYADDGAAEGTRTPDPIITNDVLYQLSYSGPVCVPRRIAGSGAGEKTPFKGGVRPRAF